MAAADNEPACQRAFDVPPPASCTPGCGSSSRKNANISSLASGPDGKVCEPRQLRRSTRDPCHPRGTHTFPSGPAARGAGVALTLLELAARYAFSLELHPVLETTADREPAIRFYERNGWRRIGTSIALWTRVSGERPTLHQYEPRPSTFGEHTARDGIMR